MYATAPRRYVAALMMLAGLIVAAGPAWAASGDGTADAVIGKPDFTTSGCNTGGFGAASLCKPMSTAVDPSSGRLYVVDWGGNDRVLSWPDAAAFTTGQAADLVIGQPNLTSWGCNNGGISASSLCGPSGVGVDANGNVYVADRGNYRVLEYDAPTTTDKVADRVFGQANFTTSGCNTGGLSASSLCQPRNVTVDPVSGGLYISDMSNHRVLGYRDPLTSDTVADIVIGQATFFTAECGRNRAGLCEPRGVTVDDASMLYVADSLNGRVLGYRNPFLRDKLADLVLGQNNYANKGCNRGGLSAHSLCAVRDVAVDHAGTVYVADTGNSRTLGFLNPLVTDHVADRVMGQPGFTTKDCNGGGIGASTLCQARGVAVDSAGNVYVADTANARELRYDLPLP